MKIIYKTKHKNKARKNIEKQVLESTVESIVIKSSEGPVVPDIRL